MSLQELLAKLAEIGTLSNEEMVELEAALRAAADGLLDAEKTAETVADLTSIADGLDAIKVETERREVEAAELAEQAAAAAARIAGEVEGEEAPAEEGEEAPADEVEVPELIAASGRATAPAAARRQPAASRARETAPSGAQIIAASGITNIAPGGVIPTMRDLGLAFVDRFKAFSGHSPLGRVERIKVATIRGNYPEDRDVRALDSAAMKSKMDQALNPSALVASGGLCAPVNVYYGLEQISVAERPVRDSLPAFQADRGGIRFIRPPVLADVLVDQAGAAITVHTVPDDEESALKTCQQVDCGDEVEVQVQAIVKCLSFGNFNARYFPEQTENFIELAAAQWARVAEQEALDAIGANSTAVTAAKVLGAARDLLEEIGRAAATYRSRNRMARRATLEVLIPEWVIDLMQADLTRQHAGDNTIALAASVIEDYLATRNVAVSFYKDSETGAGQVYGPQPAGPLLQWADEVVWYLFHPAAHRFLDGGELDLGIVRDSTQNATNDFSMFMESFEAVAFTGIESLKVTSTVCATGEGALDLDTTCASGS